MSRIATEEYVDGGSVTRLATEEYADDAGVSTDPLFSDDFSADTRANYTYITGAQAGLAVAGGELQVAQINEKVIVPTALVARTSYVAQAKLKAGHVNNFNSLILKAVANDYLQVVISTVDDTVLLNTKIAGVSNTIATYPAVPIGPAIYAWVTALLLGKQAIFTVSTTDPTVDGSGIKLEKAIDLPAAFTRGIAGKPGVRMNNTADNTARADAFHVWAVGAHTVAY